jgi:hypothetical protein
MSVTLAGRAFISFSMWVLARLITAVAAGLMRFYWRKTGVDGERATDGLAWVYRQTKNKKRVVSTEFGMTFAHPLFLRLSREGAVDRFFKSTGLAREFQAGERAFDDAVYVGCDHPAIEPLLQEDEETRAAILELFRRDARSIYTDGAHLWVRRSGDTLPTSPELALLEKIRAGLEAIPPESFQSLRDNFFWRALLLESIVWSIAGYGIPAIFEYLFRAEPLYFDWGPVIRLGLLAAVGIFLGLALLTWILLRGSSRAPRVFIACLVLLVVGVPFSSIEAISDANVILDHSPAEQISATVTRKFTTRNNGGRTRHTQYHLGLQAGENSLTALPAEIAVSRALFLSAAKGGRVTISVGPGALNFPWVQEIRASP